MILTDEILNKIKKFKNQFTIYMRNGDIFYIPKGRPVQYAAGRMIANSEKHNTIEIIKFINILYFVIDGKRYDFELPTVKLTRYQKIINFFKRPTF